MAALSGTLEVVYQIRAEHDSLFPVVVPAFVQNEYVKK
jgi:hypothetical protein